MLHMMCWSRPEIYNAVQDLSRYIFRLRRGCGDKKECEWNKYLLMRRSYYPVQYHAKIVALSATEAELIEATTTAQDMMYVKRLLESINSRVEMPMILEVDNKGAVDLINNYSVGGRTCHMGTRQYYLRELKEQGLMPVRWKAGTEIVLTFTPRI